MSDNNTGVSLGVDKFFDVLERGLSRRPEIATEIRDMGGGEYLKAHALDVIGMVAYGLELTQGEQSAVEAVDAIENRFGISKEHSIVVGWSVILFADGITGPESRKETK